jgi:hypothetical protein
VTAAWGQITPVDLSLLISTHLPREPAACVVCGSTMTVASCGGSRATKYVCGMAATHLTRLATAAPAVQAEVSDHYARSAQYITYHGDHTVVDVARELRALRTALGDDMTVPDGAVHYPHGHGRSRCDMYLRHLGHDRWTTESDTTYTHNPAHADLDGAA